MRHEYAKIGLVSDMDTSKYTSNIIKNIFIFNMLKMHLGYVVLYLGLKLKFLFNK